MYNWIPLNKLLPDINKPVQIQLFNPETSSTIVSAGVLGFRGSERIQICTIDDYPGYIPVAWKSLSPHSEESNDPYRN